ncbi:MAG: hypothetical protein DRO99_02885 [Candidatus Aenigmatarchaeota archaeon]|nr:MAG: hypothetical protein DRO99_02885 [Candidatus Aenigmarchaeota archaeon]
MIEIPEDREIVMCDEKEHPWNQDPNGYFLVKLENGLICCGFVDSGHKMIVEFRGKDPDKMIKEIADRKLCSLGNMGYIASELMIAKECLDSGKEYVQR